MFMLEGWQLDLLNYWLNRLSILSCLRNSLAALRTSMLLSEMLFS